MRPGLRESRRVLLVRHSGNLIADIKLPVSLLSTCVSWRHALHFCPYCIAVMPVVCGYAAVSGASLSIYVAVVEKFSTQNREEVHCSSNIRSYDS